MIDPEQAQSIVRDCIDEVVNTSEEYDSKKRLGQFGLIADDVVRTFTREIRENSNVGVKAFDHTLAAKELSDVDSETLTGEVEEIIMKNAVPIKPGVIPKIAGTLKTGTKSFAGKPSAKASKGRKEGDRSK